MVMPTTYEAYRPALKALVNEAWPFYGLTQVYQAFMYSSDNVRMIVKKNRRWMEFKADDGIIDPYQDAWDYFQAERLLTADAKWCDAFARKLDRLKDAPR